LHRFLRGTTGWVLAVTCYFVSMLPTVSAGGAITVSQPWIPSLGIELAFRIDGWSLRLLLLIGGGAGGRAEQLMPP